ncbi:hypothetical protein, partial [Methanobrevibacter millerae]
MKLKKILEILLILIVLINISVIYAADNDTNTLSKSNDFNIYVDSDNGNDDYDGNSWQTPVQTIGKALSLTNNTSNIYLSNGTYKGINNTQLKIENKNIINIIGSDNTIIDGENLNQILTLSNINKITLNNLQFINAINKNSNYGVAISIKDNATVFIDNCQFRDNTKSSIYNNGNLTITNTYFTNNKDRVGDRWNSILGGAIYNSGTLNINNSTFRENYAGSGGAIYNSGNLMVSNSTFRYNKATSHGSSLIVDSIKYRSDGGRGGDICNFGNATVINSTFRETQLIDLGARGGSIYNNGTMLLKQIVISDIALISDDAVGRHSAGTAIANIANLTLEDSLIANITTHVTYEGRLQGAIQNEGLLTARRTIFENNKVDKLNYHYIYYDIGSGNIYNTGEGLLDITSCIFLNNNTRILETVPQDICIRGGGALCLENNSWNGENPFKNHHIYGTLNVTRYWTISLEPEYSMLEIGEKTNVSEIMRLMYEKNTVDYSQLPDLYVTFNVNGEIITKKLINGIATVEFNQSETKGSYIVTAALENNVQKADIDVGKEKSQMEVEAAEIYYGDDAVFNIIVTGNYSHQPTGKISIIIDETKYTTDIKNTKAIIAIPKLIPKTYDLIIRYEGDEDYFKSFHHQNYTVHKRPTNMSLEIPEINYGEIGIITVTLSPEEVSTQAYMYITDENNQTTKKTVYVRNGTEVKLKNFASGTYNITIETWENRYYESTNATAIFKVNKFMTNLKINASDINAGETEILNITLLPKGEVAGEANLTINNYTQIIFLKNGENTVKIENLTGGIYNVTVTFPGDKKYAAATASTTFTVMKLQSNITARIENNILYINTTPNTTGLVLIYINEDIYEVNLTNSQIIFPINFTKAENNIFIYYQGDKNFNYSMYYLTYECEELLNLTVYDSLFYNTENATIYITLTDEEGYGIANRTITITVNNETYTKITENDGSVSLELNLPVGSYEIIAQYRNKAATNTIKVIEDAFILANDTKAYENIDFTYTLILVDHNETPIINAEITFNFENRTFTNKTDNNGEIILNFNLKEGNYTITSSYKTVNNTNHIIIVDDSHLIGNDVKAYSGTNFTYKTKLTNHNNNPIENAEITYIIGNETFTNKTNSKGESTLTFNLETGNYTIIAKYKNRTIENTFEIIEDYILRGNDVKAFSETNFTYRVNLTDHNGKAIQNAEIAFNINGENYTNTTNNNGQAVLNLNLKGGNYIITVNYRNTTTKNNIEIIEDFLLIGNDIKAYAEDNFTYRVNLTDHNGNFVENAEIIFSIENKTFTNKTNINGQAILTLSLKEGNYAINVNYRNATTTNNLEIIEDHQITGQNIKAYENTDFTYTITLTRTDGTPLTNKTITFIINNRRYTNTSNEEGKASRTLNLPANNYTITAIYKNTQITNNLTIISEDYILQANNIRAYSQRDFQYKVNLTDHNGNPIKNAEITFIFENEMFINKTDDNGQAILNLNLEKGNYTINARYNDAKITNHFEIIETYTLKGINVKSYENFDFKYVVKLTNHNNKTISNQEITFTIENKTYTNKTDSNGQATLTLNLKSGNYTITAKYNDITTTNQLNIIKYDLERIESDNLTMYYKDGSKFTARL